MLKLVGSVLAAGAIGFEREAHQKPAGLRTHILVGMSATLLVSLAVITVEVFGAELSDANLTSDPLRIFEAIVVGVSFIGAGTILKSEEGREVQNLTTAASILTTASIGIAIALDQLILATLTTLLVLLVVFLLGRLEDRYMEE